MDATVEQMKRVRWKDVPIADRHDAFNQIQIMHPQLTAAIAHLAYRLRMRELNAPPRGALFVCPPDGGKTTFWTYLKQKYPPVEMDDRTLHPFIGFSIPNPCTPPLLDNSILNALGDPGADCSESRKQGRRALKMVVEAGVKILAIDNMQDVPERRGTKGVQVVGNHFRDVIDCNVVPVFLGTQEAVVVVRSNEQLRKRAPAILPLGVYDIATPTGLSICLRIVDRFDEECPLQRQSLVAKNWIGKAIAFGANGTLGGISGLFRGAMTACVDEGLELLQLRHFHDAFNKHYAGFEDYNPFVERDRKWRRLDQPGEPFALVRG